MTTGTSTPARQAAQPPTRAEAPPLCHGDRLSRAEFERRFDAHPDIKKAELIEGVVYMPSPVKHQRHGRPHHALVTWTGTYLAATPGIEGSDNATVRLDNENEVQPDILLRIDRALGGRSFVSPEDFVEGPPEFIAEIAATSASYDMHDKKRVYARSGVDEYLVVLTFEQRVYWFVLHQGAYVELAAAADGTLRSQVFPGLWLQPDALWQPEMAALLDTLTLGLATPAHSAFVAALQTRREQTAAP